MAIKSDEPAPATPETPLSRGETTVKVSANSQPLRATVEDIGGGTILTTVIDIDPRFDVGMGANE